MTTQSPLTPADCDLRGMPYMPLFGDRLFGSATWIAAIAEAKVAALRLWWRSFAHEVPAASLPDDDALLADYAGYGIGVKAWRKVKVQAMRGWVLCTDGRLYHPVVAEVALEAWEQRKRNRAKQAKWRNKDRSVTPSVTVTEGVTEPFRNAGREGKGREVDNSEAKASGAKAPARDVLFAECLPFVIRKTGRDRAAVAKIFGKWLRDEGDDAGLIVMRLQEAEVSDVADPIAWVTARLPSTTAKRPPPESWDQRRIREGRELLARTST